MQEFRQEEEMARGESPDDEPSLEAQPAAQPEPQEALKATDGSAKATVQAQPAIDSVDDTTSSVFLPSGTASSASTSAVEPSIPPVTLTANPSTIMSAAADGTTSTNSSTNISANDTSTNAASDVSETATAPVTVTSISSSTSELLATSTSSSVGSTPPDLATDSSERSGATASVVDGVADHSADSQSPSSVPHSLTALNEPDTTSARNMTNSTPTKGSTTASSGTSSTSAKSSTATTSALSNSTRNAPAASPSSQPSTQESIFKSFAKRLQQLESNSTLSLQYIEEQSRSLRDAFKKVEQRQITATTNFLAQLNQTVMTELHGFRQAYDQLWQGTVIELEGQREQYQREMLALSSRLTLVADELVWQKRMGIVQSTLLLTCLALVLFARQGNGYAVDSTLAQQLMNRSQAALRAGWESDPNSPSPASRSPVSVFRRKLWRRSTGLPNGTLGAGTPSSRPETRDGDGVIQKDFPMLPVVDSDAEDGDQSDSDTMSRAQSSPPAQDRGLKRPPSSHGGSVSSDSQIV
ncbi:hypothetical protein LTR53_017246 [Teratosphaeriaceae sp. CCFEE 6253]|nr:hypothetical protein LTR53_017246 [Teratosphaeriaceae sp. CCFEE 6253]